MCQQRLLILFLLKHTHNDLSSGLTWNPDGLEEIDGILLPEGRWVEIVGQLECEFSGTCVSWYALEKQSQDEERRR